MAKIQDVDIPHLEFAEAAAPGTPAAAIVRLYAKADGLLYSKDDAGAETVVSGSGAGGSVATDAIWDAAGDLVQGTGANTAARLAIGAAGTVLKGGTSASWSTAGEFATQTAVVATGETTTSTTYADLATSGPSVTVTIGASFKVKVSIRCRVANNTAPKYSAVGVVISGANTVAATTILLVPQYVVSTVGAEVGASKIFTLSATGATTFNVQYLVESNTGTFTNREIIVEPVL